MPDGSALFRLFETLLFLTGFGEDHAGFDRVFGFDFPQRDENLPSGWSVSRVHICDKSRVGRPAGTGEDPAVWHVLE